MSVHASFFPGKSDTNSLALRAEEMEGFAGPGDSETRYRQSTLPMGYHASLECYFPKDKIAKYVSEVGYHCNLGEVLHESRNSTRKTIAKFTEDHI